ncbi:MAG: 5-oxoprolinase subunit PxpB [Lysobacteraceae bacterium]
MDWRIGRLGDAGLLLRLDACIDAAGNARVHALARRIAAGRAAWVRDVVPAYASLAVFVDADALGESADPLAEAAHRLRPLLDSTDDGDATAGCVVELQVRYGGADGPDLQRVAAHAGLSPADVVARHAAGDYTVAMLGFAPGFPYLLGLDPALATPRLATPRTRVPAGSVAIGGAQTGLYPREGPGGWLLIGRTDAVLFDPARASPALLCPGDRVRFLVERAP